MPLIDLGARMGVPMLTWSLKPWQRALIARLEVPHGLIREIRPRPVFLEHAITSNRLTGLSSQNAHPQIAKRSGEFSPTCESMRLP